MDGDNIAFRKKLGAFSNGLYSLGIAHKITGYEPIDIIAESEFFLQNQVAAHLEVPKRKYIADNDRITIEEGDGYVPLIKISIKYQNHLFGYLLLRNIMISKNDIIEKSSTFFIVREDKFCDLLNYIISSLDILSESVEQAQRVDLLQMRLNQTYEASNEGVWEFNIKSGEIYYSPKWYTILGYEPDELPQTFDTFLNLLHPEDKDALFAQFNDDVRNGTDFIYEYRLKDKNGDYRWVYTRGKAVGWDNEGNVTRMLGTNKNITERKETEFELKVSEEKLRQAQKLEAIGRLAGGISHDFNNLLTAIIGYSDMLSSSCSLSEESRDFLGEIMSAAKRAAALTHQLLAFSRKQVLKPKIICINELITNMEKMLARLIGEDIRMILNLEPNIKSIKVDPGQMEQVIMNLTVNSRDAMPKGGKLIVKTENVFFKDGEFIHNEEVDPGNYVMISVTDTGHGIDKKTLDHIFEPFFTTKELGKGTGLGLATVYGIVKQTGGYIDVDSRSGEGTSFLIYLPSHTEANLTLNTMVVDDKIEKGSETILLVEDEDSLRTLITVFLSNLGYNVIAAPSGIDALAKMNKSEHIKVDLLVTDVIMPEMSGKTLAEKLTLDSPETKVLFISGYTNNEIENHGILDGSVNFLQKPFSVKELAALIRTILSGEN